MIKIKYNRLKYVYYKYSEETLKNKEKTYIIRTIFAKRQ
jgi:hypothetical protein